ncbi:MAG: hypothetical protein V8Q69_11300 [Bacteroides caccae]
MRSLLIPLDQWYRRHLRMCIWKCSKSEDSLFKFAEMWNTER